MKKGKKFNSAHAPTIMQIVPELNAGGAEQTTLDITRAITGAGGRALVVSAGGRMETRVREAGGETLTINVSSKNPAIMALNVHRLSRYIRRWNVDIVHARSRAPAWSAWAATQQTATPFVTTFHGKVHATPPLKVFYGSVMTRGDTVIANSQFTAERIRQVYPGARADIVTIPRGVDMQAFNPEQVSVQARADQRRRWGVAENELLFFLPARLTRWKGHQTAIEALAQTTGLPACTLIITGDEQGRTGYRAELDKLIATHRLEERVRIFGHCQDMQTAYAAADIVLSPSSEPEPFGRPPVEAQAMETPVIVSDHGGARETVLEGTPAERTGWRVTPGDPSALARALGEAAAMPVSLRTQTGKRGRAWTGKKFSLSMMCQETLAVYDRLLAQC